MPGEQYVRVGQVADALGLSAYQVRRYCDSGVIKSVVIEGQRLIPLDEFHRVQREGVGPMPRTIDPQQHRPARRVSDRTYMVRHRSGHGFVSPRSSAVVRSGEEVEIVQNRAAAKEARIREALAELKLLEA